MTYIVKSNGTELIRVTRVTRELTLDELKATYSFPDYDPATYTLTVEEDA